ncbi:type II secretion system minor pseudopilin GspK [Acinetobacter johnsonii]|uniref:Type II secretion system protein K n=1 Tax=Acinetobacter johnsonii TaxID=40214 RepID=A0A1R7QEU8_ACIJO|nr:type II secretion system minor pseudopilin GspK [Acinetobacter johnsonii]SJX22803.1 Type II secretion system protein K [Acinetobacter johnsonii]
MKRSQHGIALITILVMVALATILAATIAKHQRNTAEGTAYLMRQNQALLYAKSAEAFFSELLVDDAQNTAEVDHLQETWAKPMPTFPVEDGFVSGRLEDESGKFNLNALVKSDKKPNEAAKLWFEKLLVRVGLPAQLSEAVIDWQDEDDEVSGPMGAESAYYQSLAQGYLAPNRAFYNVEQLKLVRGFEGRNYQLIAPYVSALPSNELKVNVNTAHGLVLASIDPKLDVSAIQNLQKQRQANLEYFSNMNELWEVDPFKQVDEAQRAAVNDFLGVQSNYFKARIEVQLSERKRQFSSDLVRKDQAVYVVYRSMSPF